MPRQSRAARRAVTAPGASLSRPRLFRSLSGTVTPTSGLLEHQRLEQLARCLLARYSANRGLGRASLLPEPRRGILRVRLPRQSQAHLDEALEPVLQELN